MRVLVALLAFAGLWIIAPAGQAQQSTARKPNVIVILADDLGYGDLGCYGARDVRTPNIDRLAAAGMKLTRYYTNSSVCSPTRAALLTGRYPERVGVPGVIRTTPQDSWGHLQPDAVLLPTLLKRAGYHTALIGKWHLGLTGPNAPTARGFDFFHGFLGDMMEDYYTHRRHGINYMRQNDREIDPKGHATDLFTQWAIDYIHDRAPQGPFFLYLAYNAPHDPLQPTAESLTRVQQREPALGEKRTKLLALIEHLDEGVGKMLAALRQAGVENDTLVIFTSDNGGALNQGASNGRLRAGKGTMYEGGLRVPCCVRWTGKVPVGTTDRVALSMDLLPTTCAAAGAPVEHAIEGRSFLPTLLGKGQPAEQRDLFFIRREGGAFKGKTIHAVMRGDWKLVQNTPGGPLELYDLKQDPQEQRDAKTQRPDVLRALTEALQAHVERGERVPWRPQ